MTRVRFPSPAPAARAKIASLALVLGLCAAASAPALAQAGAGEGSQPGQPTISDQPPQEPAGQPSIRSSLGEAGDPGGLRALFEAKGIAYSLTYIGETFGIASGAQRRGAVYDGRLDGQLDVDLGKLLDWQGARFHTNVYQIHGPGLSRHYLGNLLAVSGIEALSSTRLFELWVEQKIFDGAVSVRVGQLAADSEFITSDYAALFVNSAFGWPGIAAANLPNGGPAYPLATPAIRVEWSPSEQLTFRGAVFNGYPSGNGPGDPQANNRAGLEFRTGDPAFWIGEAVYAYNQAKDAQAKDAAGLPGKVKIGGWYHAARFDSLRYAELAPGATSGLLADPTGSGTARRLPGNVGVYGVLDQLIYRVPGTSDQGLGLFLRASASPGDRNLVDVYADGGLTYKGLVPGRPDDVAGIAGAYAQISSGARGFDRDSAAFADPGTFVPLRSSEALIEISYQAQIVPGWTVQPDVQYVWRPGGHVVNPRSPVGDVVKNAAIVGLRTTIRY